MRKKRVRERKGPEKKKSPSDSPVICTNRDCKLRKQKNCRGFEGCPGFQGR
jgi:hypothetical protein